MRTYVLAAAALWAILFGQAHAQSPMLPGFPPGTFQNRAALDASSTPPAYTGPGDCTSCGGSAYAWWGLRAYTAAYAASTGNIADLVAVTGGAAVCTLKAATDGTADIVGTYCGGSTVPVACAAASGGSCKVTKLYDQTGGGRDLSQATLATMPDITFGPVTGLASNRPALTFSNAQFMATASPFGLTTQPLTMSAVSIRTAAIDNIGMMTGDVANDAEMIYTTTTPSLAGGYAGTNPPITQAQTNNAWHSFHAAFNGASTVMNVDGSSSAAGNTGNGAITNAVYFGRDTFQSSGAYLTGRITEAGIWSSALTGTNMTNLYNNQKSYWGY